MYYLLQAVEADSGLTAGEVIETIPHDSAAVFVYVFIAFSLWLVWWAHRHSEDWKGLPPRQGEAEQEDTDRVSRTPDDDRPRAA